MPGGSSASAPRSPPSTPSAWITSSASPATGRSRAASRRRSTGAGGAGPGARFFDGAAARAAAASCRSSPRTSGVVTPEVQARCATSFGLPGIRILQFAFGNDPNAPDFLPHNYPRNAVVYTGTHDNDTTVGLVPRCGQRHAQRRTRRSGAAGGARATSGRDPDGARARSTGSMIRAGADVGRQRGHHAGAGPARARVARRA